MLLFLFFYLLIIPASVLLHEVGHGIAAVSTSKSHAHVYLGTRSKVNKENFKLGRLHFHLNWSYVGFVSWEGNLTKRQTAIALAGGPIISLLLMLLFGLISLYVPQDDLHSLLFGATIFNCFQFLFTIIPITYPRWMGVYNGQPSDGLQLLRLLKK
ncbi:hypothetical protein CHH83_18815 [Bacillus sp. 7586-K]|nr:hypothetical protein CHH83_18815 [Bacillus sp. 7586-K]